MAKHQHYTGSPLVDDLLLRLTKLEKDNEDSKKQIEELNKEVYKLRLYVPTY